MKPNNKRSSERWAATIHTGVSTVTLTGYALIALVLGGFGIWAAGVPLAGAVNVPGVVEAAGNNNKIQRDKSAEMVFDDTLLALADRHKLRHLLDEQDDEFRARLSRYQSEEVILRQRVAAAKQSIAGYESQRVALEEQKR